jgi:molybdopterin converting factor small subunit
MTTVTVYVFAVLKEYFKPSFELTIAAPTIENLLHTLIELNPSCETIIKRSRFAIDETIVDLTYKLNSNDKIFILPPSSGG